MPLSPLLTEGVGMTSSGQTCPFQQRPGEMNSSLESNRSHDKGTRAEGANGDSGEVALWWEKGGGRKAGTGGNQRIKAAKESEESTDDSFDTVLVNWKDVAS